MDNDGDLDIVVVNAANEANIVWLNDGSGTFSNGQSLGAANSYDVRLGDVDGDGDLDALVANFDEGDVVWLNDGAGSFTDQQSLASTSNHSIPLGDLDNDGDLDAFVGNWSGQANTVYINNSSTVNTAPTAPTGLTSIVTKTFVALSWAVGTDTETPVNLLSYHVVITDSAGLTQTVPAHANPITGYRRVPSLGNTNLRLTSSLTLSTAGTYTWSVQTVDSGWAGSPFAPPVTFTIVPQIVVDSGQSLASSLSLGFHLGDVDGDGDMDAFVANNSNQANELWLNDGSGTFSDSGQNIGSSSSFGVSLGDVDGDGDLDAFVANFGQDNKVWMNDGSGTFSDSGQALGSASSSTEVSLGDLDGDGDLDAFVTNGNSEANKIWFNDGGGLFTDSGQNLGNSRSFRVVLGDVDGDGHLDGFVANGNSEADIVWFNDGSGAFSDRGQALGGGISSQDVSLGDLDGDGDLDAVVTNNSDNRVLFNDGNGMFFGIGLTLDSSNSYGVSLGDLDGDGDLDAVFANFGFTDSANTIWLNSGGSFTFAEDFGSTSSVGVGLSDLDGDGDLDAFVANEGAHKVWLNNDSTPTNTAPTAPTGLNQNVVGDQVTLSWTAGTDTETPNSLLSYHVVVTDSAGVTRTVPAQANLSTGYRRVPGLGNAGQSLTLVFTVTKPGTYQWSVQTIDSSWRGSPFATQNNFVRSTGHQFVIPPREQVRVYLPLVVK